MEKKLEKQLKLIDFIKENLSNKEGEQYFVRRVNLYHPNYTFFGDNFYIGSLLIICNKTYNDAIDGFSPNKVLYGPWYENRNPEWEEEIDNQVLRAQTRPSCINKGNEEMKVILIKYYYLNGCYDFKKVLHGKKVKDDFPYIIESLSYLKNEKLDNADIDCLMQELSNNMDKDQKVKKIKL